MDCAADQRPELAHVLPVSHAGKRSAMRRGPTSRSPSHCDDRRRPLTGAPGNDNGTLYVISYGCTSARCARCRRRTGAALGRRGSLEGGIMKRPLFLLIPLCLLLLLPAAASAKAKPTFDQAIDQLFAQGYPQAVDTHLIAMPGTNPQLGVLLGGHLGRQREGRLPGQRRCAPIGLKNVHLDPVPVDVFNFKSASVDDRCEHVGGLDASPASGRRRKQGITGQVVYAHEGTAAGLRRTGGRRRQRRRQDRAARRRPHQLLDERSRPRRRPTAARPAIIFTYGPTTAPYWTYATDALASFDSEFDLSDVPAVYISQQDGDLAAQPADRRRRSGRHHEARSRRSSMATDGGTGYNVVGDLPGTVQGRQLRAVRRPPRRALPGAAPTTAPAWPINMAIAKAMVMSGYRPAAHRALHDHDRRGVRLHQLLQRLVHRRLVGHHPRPSRLGRQDPRLLQRGLLLRFGGARPDEPRLRAATSRPRPRPTPVC